jgi:hypothetical protein
MASLEFEDIMKQLGDRLKINLEVGETDTCTVQLADGCVVEFSESRPRRRLLLLTQLGELSPGPFRIRVLHKALQANHSPPPRAGTLCFSKRMSMLLYQQDLDLDTLEVEGLLEVLADFSKEALSWKDALRRGDVPDIQVEGASEKSSLPLFGLQP